MENGVTNLLIWHCRNQNWMCSNFTNHKLFLLDLASFFYRDLSIRDSFRDKALQRDLGCVCLMYLCSLAKLLLLLQLISLKGMCPLRVQWPVISSQWLLCVTNQSSPAQEIVMWSEKSKSNVNYLQSSTIFQNSFGTLVIKLRKFLRCKCVPFENEISSQLHRCWFSNPHSGNPRFSILKYFNATSYVELMERCCSSLVVLLLHAQLSLRNCCQLLSLLTDPKSGNH